MNISIVAAMDLNAIIGKNGGLPWYLPEDLAHFRELTLNQIVIMGRKTFDSIGRPLKDRINVVMTRDLKWAHSDVIVCHSIYDVLESFQEPELFIIGGTQIFATFLEVANKIYLTEIDDVFDGDTYFPKVQWEQWRTISSQKPYRSNICFYEYQRITN